MTKALVPEQPLNFIRECVFARRVRWTYHATMRMEQRSIGSEMLFEGVDSLEIIEPYADDRYLPSYLVRGLSGGRVFHAQIAADVEARNVRVVTMYLPTPAEWDAEFRVRRVRR